GDPPLAGRHHRGPHRVVDHAGRRRLDALRRPRRGGGLQNRGGGPDQRHASRRRPLGHDLPRPLRRPPDRGRGGRRHRLRTGGSPVESRKRDGPAVHGGTGPAPRRVGGGGIGAGPGHGRAARVAGPATGQPADRARRRGGPSPGEPVTASDWPLPPRPRPRRVFILDDHTVVRAGVRLLLDDENDLVVVGESSSIAEFVAQPVAYDVVVADLILPDASGDEVVTAVRGHAPDANVLILSMVDDVNAAALALRAGAVGYLTKDAAALELVDAVRSVAEGRRYLQPALGAQLATGGVTPDRSTVLRDDELAVLRLLALGHTNAEVARLLGVSLRTVESRRARLFGKLGVRTRAELFRYAADIGLLHRTGLDSPHRH